MSANQRDIDLDALNARLRALNPGLTTIRAEMATRPEADIRVVVETTRAEMEGIGGRLALSDSALEGLRIETAIKFLDHAPGEQLRVELRRIDNS